ncbi:phospholipase A1-like [Eupeodes corollae]|uniref:phospholipase A1-like n=1 Tax=Eupeodes corollae TaxID=290404 RepID=UPI002493BA30|nr:phospholipase A1-like [Eupeodes corollae]
MTKSFVLNFLILIVIGTIGRCATIPIEPEEDTVWPIPQIDGTVKWMTEHQAVARAESTDLPSFPNKLDKVSFFLYTQLNPTKPIELVMSNKETIVRSTFNFSNPTRFMLHGWTDMHNRSRSSVIREALLHSGQKQDTNFIAIDWSVYSSTLNYVSAKEGCPKAGKDIATFLDWMHETSNLNFDSVTLIGHSLGAHVAGFAAKNVQRGKIGSIIGLDPTMPLFPYNDPESRLASTDAVYVESIQTNGGMKGYLQPIGQITFYPNGGRMQPGCKEDFSGSCSHLRSISLFAEGVRTMENNQLFAVRCRELKHIRNGSCDQYSNIARVGDPSNTNKTRGIYYLKTGREFPFGMGLKALLKN